MSLPVLPTQKCGISADLNLGLPTASCGWMGTLFCDLVITVPGTREHSLFSGIFLPAPGQCNRRSGDRSPSTALSAPAARIQSESIPTLRTDPLRGLAAYCYLQAPARSAPPVWPWGESGLLPVCFPPTASIATCHHTRGPCDRRRSHRRLVRAETCSGRNPRRTYSSPK